MQKTLKQELCIWIKFCRGIVIFIYGCGQLIQNQWLCSHVLESAFICSWKLVIVTFSANLQPSWLHLCNMKSYYIMETGKSGLPLFFFFFWEPVVKTFTSTPLLENFRDEREWLISLFKSQLMILVARWWTVLRSILRLHLWLSVKNNLYKPKWCLLWAERGKWQQLCLVPSTLGTIKFSILGVPVMAQGLTNLTRNHEVAGSISGLAQWVKDLALPWAVV